MPGIQAIAGSTWREAAIVAQNGRRDDFLLRVMSIG